MNHTYSKEFCEPCDSAYRSYACVMTSPKQPSEDIDEQMTAYDLAVWLINFEFQDPRNRYMNYRELARIYATKIEQLINDRLDSIELPEKQLTAEGLNINMWEEGFNFAIDQCQAAI